MDEEYEDEDEDEGDVFEAQDPYERELDAEWDKGANDWKERER